MMKIRVTLLVEVDAERWREVYPSEDGLHDDLRNYIRQLVANSPLADVNAICKAELDRRVL